MSYIVHPVYRRKEIPIAVNPLNVEAEIKKIYIFELIFYHKISPRLLDKMTYYSMLRMIHNLFNSFFICGILHLFQVFTISKKAVLNILMCSAIYLWYICWGRIIGLKNLRMLIPYKYTFWKGSTNFPLIFVWECSLCYTLNNTLYVILCVNKYWMQL